MFDDWNWWEFLTGVLVGYFIAEWYCEAVVLPVYAAVATIYLW